jgi:hypothetical protein
VNLLIAFHIILKNEESLGPEEEVEDVGREDFEVAGQKESSDGGQEHSKQEDEEEEG